MLGSGGSLNGEVLSCGPQCESDQRAPTAAACETKLVWVFYSSESLILFY